MHYIKIPKVPSIKIIPNPVQIYGNKALQKYNSTKKANSRRKRTSARVPSISAWIQATFLSFQSPFRSVWRRGKQKSANAVSVLPSRLICDAPAQDSQRTKGSCEKNISLQKYSAATKLYIAQFVQKFKFLFLKFSLILNGLLVLCKHQPHSAFFNLWNKRLTNRQIRDIFYLTIK